MLAGRYAVAAERLTVETLALGLPSATLTASLTAQDLTGNAVVEDAMAKVLDSVKSGGTIAFSTWPPELLIGRSFTLVGSYMPPPPPGVSPPPQWGDPNIVRERLGTAVTEIVFDRDRMNFPALSLPGYRAVIERTAGPMLKLVEMLSASDPARLTEFRREYDALLAPYFENNILRQDYLLTRATKR